MHRWQACKQDGLPGNDFGCRKEKSMMEIWKKRLGSGKLLFGIMLFLVLSLGFGSIQAEAAPKLNKKNATVTVGKTVKLKVKGTKKRVKWSSSNKKVCTVSKSGVVKGKKVGTATIKAKVSRKTLKCKVKVKAKKSSKPTPTPTPTPDPTPVPEPVKPTGITLTGAFSKVAPGTSLQLQMGFIPADATPEAVKWYTDNSSVASVSDTGLVVTKKTGKVKITAELESNWRIQGSFKLEVEDLTVDSSVTTADGGDLLLNDLASRAVYSYSISFTAADMVTQVTDGIGTVLRSWPMGTMGAQMPYSVTWDLTDANGNRVAPGSYCFQVVAAGKVIKRDYFSVYARSEFGAGNGSPASPYEISTLDHLKAIYKHNGACFKQTTDIVVGLNESVSPLFSTDAPFEGTYDGNNYSIQKLSINLDNDNIGLFTAIGKKGSVKNLVIKGSFFNGRNEVGSIAAINSGSIINCRIEDCGLDSSRGRAGILVSANYGLIQNCKTDGEKNTIKADEGSAGGLCAYNKGVITDCISENNELAISGYHWSVGGIVGINEGQVIKCTALSVTMNSVHNYNTRSGGIVGTNGSTVANCSAKDCTIDGAEWKGKVIGYNEGNAANNTATGMEGLKLIGNGKN